MEKKVLLIIGASSDIGMAYIEKYNKNFEIILAHYRKDSEHLLLLQKKIGSRMILLQADLLHENETYEFIEAVKRLDYQPTCILHLPAAQYENHKFNKILWSSLQRSMDIQLRSAILIIQSFLPFMLKGKKGQIVFMLSSCTVGTAPKYVADYVTVKYAILGLMKALASEYAGKGISINAVSPCMMETKYLSDIPDLIIRQNAEKNPCGCNASVMDVIPTIDFLLSDGVEFMTGQNILISGGM